MYPALLDLPVEILHNILTYVDPSDLVSVRLCCHQLHELLKSDGLLFKEIFLKLFVRPANSSRGLD